MGLSGPHRFSLPRVLPVVSVVQAYRLALSRMLQPWRMHLDNIEARAEHGVLKLVVKKKPTSQPRRIEIQD